MLICSDDALQDESFLEPLEQSLLEELSERVENLDIQLEYKTSLVVDAQQQALPHCLTLVAGSLTTCFTSGC